MDLAYRGVLPAAIGKCLASPKFGKEEGGAGGEDREDEENKEERETETGELATWRHITAAEEQAVAEAHRLRSEQKQSKAPAYRVAQLLILGLRKARRDYAEAGRPLGAPPKSCATPKRGTNGRRGRATLNYPQTRRATPNIKGSVRRHGSTRKAKRRKVDNTRTQMSR